MTMADFVTVAKAGDVSEGETIAVDVGGTPVAIALVDGVYHAFDDTCTHRQCSLSEGELEGNTITCPCHGSQFDVTSGDVITGPAVDAVASYPVAVEGDAIRIEI